jgi:phage-related minor tail protein
LLVLIYKPLIESLTNAFSPTAVGGSVVGGLISNLFPAANGAAINNGNVVPFAYGGVVNSPTLFGMSGGRTGLMGEAGPEAILPLKRGAGGKLGVEGGGNVTVHQSFNFAANGDESVKKIIAEAAPGIAKMTEAQIVNSRQRGGQMRRVFS